MDMCRLNPGVHISGPKLRFTPTCVKIGPGPPPFWASGCFGFSKKHQPQTGTEPRTRISTGFPKRMGPASHLPRPNISLNQKQRRNRFVSRGLVFLVFELRYPLFRSPKNGPIKMGPSPFWTFLALYHWTHRPKTDGTRNPSPGHQWTGLCYGAPRPK